MNAAPLSTERPPSRELWTLRLSILIGGVLISLFMIGDLELVPQSLAGLYFGNRVYGQLPLILCVFALTFHPRFHEFSQPVFLVGILALTFINYSLIYQSWERADFSFPYEGTLLYAFFGFFVLGMRFRYALISTLLSSIGFAALMLYAPIYGEYTFMNLGFVLGSLFIGVIARFRLDRLLDRLQLANTQLHGLSRRDSLSGLLNRRAFETESETLFDVSSRSQQPLAIFMIDLDHFKQFNDQHGHQAGDEAIRRHAEIMQQVFRRKTDVLGRYGGEEFIAVTLSQGSKHIQHQAEKILAGGRHGPLAPDSLAPGRSLSCSIGICHGPPDQFESLGEMIRLADEALYRAKAEGRARFALAEPKYSQPSQ